MLLFSPILIGIVGVVLAVIVLGIIIFKRYRIANPDQAIIVTGRKGKAGGSDTSGQKVVTGGGIFVMPFVQKDFSLSLRSRQIPVETTAQTSHGITIKVRAVAVVKVGGSDDMIRAAAQRFLSQQDEIELSTQEVLSGSLRGIVGSLTVDEIIRDRQKLAQQVLSAAEEALTKQGLIVDTLQIQEISDTDNYIVNLGRPEAANAKRLAEVAETNASKDAERARIEAQQEILEQTRLLELREASIKEETDVARASAEAALPREQAVQKQRIVEAEEVTAKKQADLEEQQLNASVRKVADAEAYRIKTIATADAEAQASLAEGRARADIASAEADKMRRELDAAALEREGKAQQISRSAIAEAVRAEGLAEAEAIEAKGRAEAFAIEQRATALEKQSSAVLAQDAIALLPAIAHEFASGYSNIDKFTVVSADGVNKITGDMAGSMTGMFEMIKDSAGLDIPTLINSSVTGNAIGNGIAGKKEQ